MTLQVPSRQETLTSSSRDGTQTSDDNYDVWSISDVINSSVFREFQSFQWERSTISRHSSFPTYLEIEGRYCI